MGMDDRDGAYRSRGQSPRRRPYDGDDLPMPSSSRAPREMNSARYDSEDRPARLSSRGPREMDSPRSRPPRREYEPDGDYTRSPRDPRGAPRGSSSGRHERDGFDRDDFSRRPRSGASPRSDRRSYDGGNDDYDRSSRFSRSDPGASSPRGERNMRSGRPSSRDDNRGDPRGARAGARGAPPADSNGRMRRPAPHNRRGGLWDDEAEPLGGLNGGNKSRDPRARRFAAQQEEEEKSSPAAAIAKTLGAIVLALVLGAGSAYGYFVVNVPSLHVSPDQQATPPSPTSAPSASPSPSATKSALQQRPATVLTLLVY
jgi:hypothetical protein